MMPSLTVCRRVMFCLPVMMLVTAARSRCCRSIPPRKILEWALFPEHWARNTNRLGPPVINRPDRWLARCRLWKAERT